MASPALVSPSSQPSILKRRPGSSLVLSPIFPLPLAAAGGEAPVAPSRTHFEYLGLG